MVNHCSVCRRELEAVGFFLGTVEGVLCIQCMNARQQMVMLAVIESILIQAGERVATMPTDGKVH